MSAQETPATRKLYGLDNQATENFGARCLMARRLVERGVRFVQVLAPIAPGPKDIVIRKQKPSGFFGSNLASFLTLLGCDSIIVTGTTTSGCVRATVVDSLQRSFRTIVPEECVADKHESPHFANLYDMALKYADILPVAEVVAFMEQYKPAN